MIEESINFSLGNKLQAWTDLILSHVQELDHPSSSPPEQLPIEKINRFFHKMKKKGLQMIRRPDLETSYIKLNLTTTYASLCQLQSLVYSIQDYVRMRMATHSFPQEDFTRVSFKTAVDVLITQNHLLGCPMQVPLDTLLDELNSFTKGDVEAMGIPLEECCMEPLLNPMGNPIYSTTGEITGKRVLPFFDRQTEQLVYSYQDEEGNWKEAKPVYRWGIG
jgi:hypothetical protein